MYPPTTFRLAIGVAGLLAGFLMAEPTLRAQSLTELGDFGGGASIAYGINNSGQVVGVAYTYQGNPNAFLYSDGSMTDLASFDSLNGLSVANGINDAGQVVGWISSATGEEAFLYANGTMSNLGALGGFPYNNYSAATSINSSGQVVGYSNGSAFLYSNGTMSSLGALQGTGSAGTAINNSGQVAGYSDTDGPTITTAFLNSGGTITSLGTLGGVGSSASGINNLGQVVGSSYPIGSQVYHAFLYSGGKMIDLGTLGGAFSEAWGINDSGDVVGDAYTDDSDDAFIYSSSTGMQDLNTIYASLLVTDIGSKAGFTSLTEARGINSSGEIVGYGDYWTGTTDEQEAFLLNPAAVPEPSTWVLFLSGCGVLSFVYRRQA